VEAKHECTRSSLSLSIGAHALAIALVVVLAARSERTPVFKVDPRLVLPASLIMPPITSAPAPTTPSIALPSKAPAKAAATAPRAADTPPAAPVEEPSSIEPETAVLSTDGADAGVAGGIDKGPVGEPASSGIGSSGPLRVGGSMGPPRKIKDVRPQYPEIALLEHVRGAVVIDITIGTDGKVQEAKVVQSVPRLDQAALQAVRQWEYEPTQVNGVLVALVMTVIITFAIQ
jgi:protein TonB